MKRSLSSLVAIVILSGAFITEAVNAFPPNDWPHPLRSDRFRP
jgi:hypothetical protein